MADLSSVLANIPGLGGYLAQQQHRQGQQDDEMGRNLQRMKLADVLKGQQREQKMRDILMQSGGDPAKASQALLGAGYPEEAAKIQGMVTKPTKTWTQGSQFNPETGTEEKFLYDAASADPQSTMIPVGGAKKEKAEAEKRSSYAQQLIDEGIPQGTPDFYRRMNAYNLAESQGKGKPLATVTNIMPGTKEAVDIPKFRKQVQESIAPYKSTVDAADTSLAMLRLAIKEGNPTAFQGSRVQLAKAFGDANITANEIKSAGGDPSIWGGLMNSTSTLFTGTPSVELMNGMERTLNALKKVAKAKAKNEIGIQRKIGKSSGFKDEDLDLIFQFSDYDTSGGQDPSAPIIESRILSSGKKVTVTVSP